jgi:hypothetical protein
MTIRRVMNASRKGQGEPLRPVSSGMTCGLFLSNLGGQRARSDGAERGTSLSIRCDALSEIETDCLRRRRVEIRHAVKESKEGVSDGRSSNGSKDNAKQAYPTVPASCS